jgi:hypothetical protein
VAETSRALRAHGVDPDLTTVRGDQQHLLVPYQRPLIRECHEAYLLARACQLAPEHSLSGYLLGQVWDGQSLAAIGGQAIRSVALHRMMQARGRRAANQARKDAADRALLEDYSRWQRRVAAALVVRGKPMSAEERVRKYIATGQIKTYHKKTRIRALLQAGSIPPLR